MALIDDVAAVLGRLALHWQATFEAHGLDITVPASALAQELNKLLQVDHEKEGFEEFAFDGRRAVEPGIPGQSLLYHALASADVRPPGVASEDYPTLAELDMVENYIYAAARRSLGSFANPVIAVFAYQYRDANLAPHQRHADLCYSRCGIARVGSEASRYDPVARSFDPRPINGDRGFATLPARYAAFIAEYRSPTLADQVLRPVANDPAQTFLFPVHKLFPGDECLFRADGGAINIAPLVFTEYHSNDKLRRIHTNDGDNPAFVPPLAMFDLDSPPYFRDSSTTKFVTLATRGASVLVAPEPGPIVATGRQEVDGQSEIARFKVPRQAGGNRFWTSLEISATSRGRAAPEYANIRQEVRSGGLVDLNLVPREGTPPQEQFEQVVQQGGYEAAHFIDGTADGFLKVEPLMALSHLLSFPAFSLVSAVDYFPQVTQVDVTEWIERDSGAPIGLGSIGEIFPAGGPQPLSDGRFGVSQTGQIFASRRIPNQALKTHTGASAFPAEEAASRTVTAIVGRSATAGAGTRVIPPPFATTWLPDAASDVFAPGWDVSLHRVANPLAGNFNDTYASYGLGSPFPEDAKLCAALNSFWPAIAPDSSRTFGFHPGTDALLTTSIPLADGELGYDAGHPRVLAGEAFPTTGWDGETGPYYRNVGGKLLVNAVNAARSDQTRQALDGKLGFSGLDQIDTASFIGRLHALRFTRKQLRQPVAGESGPWLITFEVVQDWSNWSSIAVAKLDASLTGSGYAFDFAYVNARPKAAGDPPLRLDYDVLDRITVQLDATRGFVRQGSESVFLLPRT
jgi:hypothetical protein